MTKSAPQPHATPVLRVVIADGDADTRMLYREMLDGLPLAIVDVEDGRDALVQCLLEPPALLIADTHLSVIDGYQLCEVLRTDRATVATPILIVTSETRPAELARLRRLGRLRILSKPLLSDDFGGLVRAVCDGGTGDWEQSAAPLETKSTSRTYRRFATTSPPLAPPALSCGDCDKPLDYRHSRVGGVSGSDPEQWDQFRCLTCFSDYEYRHRTRKLRRLADRHGD